MVYIRRFKGYTNIIFTILVCCCLFGCSTNNNTNKEPDIISKDHNIITIIPHNSVSDSYVNLCLDSEREYDVNVYLYNHDSNSWEMICGASGCLAKRNDLIVIRNNALYLDLRGKSNISIAVNVASGASVFTSTHDVYNQYYSFDYYSFNNKIVFEENKEMVLGYQVLSNKETYFDLDEMTYYHPETMSIDNDSSIICVTLIIKS